MSVPLPPKGLSGEIRTYKFVDFTSQLKIGLSSIEKIYLVSEISGNAKTYLYSNKVTDLLESIPIIVILCYYTEMKHYETLNKHTSFQQRYKMIQRQQ